jgi:cell division protein FtsZ
MELGKEGEEKKLYNQASLEFQEEPQEAPAAPADEMAPTLVEDTPRPRAETPKAPPVAEVEQPRLIFELSPEPEPAPAPRFTPEPEAEAETEAETQAPEQTAPAEDPAPLFEAPAPEPLELRQDAPRPAPENKPAPGGFLTRPTHIYQEPPAGAEAREPQPAQPRSDIKLVYRDDAPPREPRPSQPARSAEAGQPVTVVNLEQTEEQRRIAAERIARLRHMSFNVRGTENRQELETVPAYIRREIPLDPEAGSDQAPYSGYSVKKSADGKHAEISTINTFLDGKKPD